MFLTYSLIIFGVLVLGVGIVVLVNLISDSRPKINKVAAPWRDPMNNPHYRKAMEELDEIDITLGIMDPKPKPHQYIKAPKTVEYSELSRISFEQKKMAAAAHARYQQKLAHDIKCMKCDKPGIHTHVIPAIQTETARK